MFNLLPVAALIGLMFAGGGKAPEPKPRPAIKSVTSVRNADSQVHTGTRDRHGPRDHQVTRDLDYQTIHHFITSRYKKISADDARKISRYLVQYARKHDMDPKLVAALMARESSFNRRAISSTGAKGLGQIKDFNYKSLNIRDPYDIRQNVSGTVSYLKQMITGWRKHSERKVSLGLASYFKGINAVKRSNGQYDKKTDGYVKDILKNYDKIKGLKSKLARGED